MADVVVWRLENERGVGPYVEGTGQLREDLREAHGYDDEHPGLGRLWYEYEDNYDPHVAELKDAGVCIEDMHCGCESELQLNTWFAGFKQRILDSGFRVVKYRVDREHTVRDGRQVAFVKSLAERIEEDDG